MLYLTLIKQTVIAALTLMTLSIRGQTAPSAQVNQIAAAASPNVSKMPPPSTSGLTVVYVPYESWREFRPQPSDLQKELRLFLARRDSHPIGTEDYAAAIHLQPQKDVLLGLLAFKGIPVKPADGASEILIADQELGKIYFVDQYGIVTDSLRSFQLSPLAFHKLHVLLDGIFTLPNGGWHSEPDFHPVMTPGLKLFQQKTERVHPGMNNAEARSLLGVPDLVEKYPLLNSRHWYEVWYWSSPDDFNRGFILEVDDTDHVLPAGIYPN